MEDMWVAWDYGNDIFEHNYYLGKGRIEGKMYGDLP